MPATQRKKFDRKRRKRARSDNRADRQDSVRISPTWVRALAALGVAWALFSPSLGAAILPPDTLKSWWHDLHQSETEEAVAEYVDEVEDAAIWAQAPKTYEPSVRYFEKNYDELDPTKVHEFPRIGEQEAVTLSFLATESAGWTGRMVLVSSDVREPPRLISPVTDEVGSYQITLADRRVPGTEVICRLPFERTLPFRKGDRVTFTGLVLADGLAERQQAAGMKRVIYMACSSMVPSMNISLVPGPRGDGKKPDPVLEVNP